VFESILRVIFGVISVALLIGAFVGAEGFEDSDSESAMLPPCSVDEGLPFIDDDEVTCYWGMSEEILELPSEIDLAEVLISVQWEKSNVWIGIAEASEASKCTQKDGYYECEKFAIDLVAGGEASDGGFMWNATSGDYRFVAGGDDVQSLQQFEVEWKYEATLPQSTAWPLVGLGILFAVFAALGPKRVWEWVSDLILVA
jgi:hypothetical protein